MDTSTTILALVVLLVGLAIGLGVGLALAHARRQQPRAGGELAALLTPAADTMGRIESQLSQVERDRIEAYAALREQVAALHRTSTELGNQASTLAGALAAPQVRGRWGEVQLQRIVELAGMVEHCDFDTQVTAHGAGGAGRPDMVVRLAGGRNVPVDAKAPMAAWLRACERDRPGTSGSVTPGPRPFGYDDVPGPRALLTEHARAVRSHVDALAAKTYWRLFDPAPEFVVMFVPGEAFLDAALSADPALTEYAFERQVVIATPSTLIALLRTIAFTWRQERLARSAEEVHTLGRELYHRLTTFGDHLAKVGTGLDRAVGSYNAAVRSLDSRVLVSARRFADLGVTGEDLPGPEQIHTAASVPGSATSGAAAPPDGTAAAGATGSELEVDVPSGHRAPTNRRRDPVP